MRFRYRLIGFVALFLFVVLLGNSSATGGEVLYALSPAEVFMSRADHRPVGILETGASVFPASENGGWYKLRIKGWQLKGLPSVIYAFEGIRIIKMELNSSGEKMVKMLGTFKDKATGYVWEKVAVEGVWVNGRYLSKSMKKVWKRASDLFHERCSMCHALPKTTEFTANQWPATLRVMTKRAALNGEQTEIVSMFLQYHARDTINRR